MGNMIKTKESNESLPAMKTVSSAYILKNSKFEKYLPKNNCPTEMIDEGIIFKNKETLDDFEFFFGNQHVDDCNEVNIPQLSANTKESTERTKYFNKLIDTRTWTTTLEITTILVFDWDDTLFCTSEFKNRRDSFSLGDDEFKKQVKRLDCMVSDLLSLAKTLGFVYIVTNAESNWVNGSCEKMMPITFKQVKNINIISARDECKQFYPKDNKMWKLSVFKIIAAIFKQQKYVNLISVGDSEFEIEAGLAIRSKFSYCTVKVVKLMEQPTVKYLIKEIRILKSNIFLLLLS